jgi:hypothetical protein
MRINMIVDPFDAHCTQRGSQAPRPRAVPIASWAAVPA